MFFLLSLFFFSFLFGRKEFMQEVILVLNIGGTGLFTRLNRRKKKNKKKKQKKAQVQNPEELSL